MDRGELLATRIGLILVAVGAYLPWITTHPRRNVELLAYPGGLGSGLEIWGLLTLPLAALALGGTVVENRRCRSRSFRLLVGLVAAGASMTLVVGGPGITGPSVIGSGVALTLVGGILVVGVQLPALWQYVAVWTQRRLDRR